MRAVRLYGPRDLRLAEEPDPVPGPGESLVRVDSMGICGSRSPLVPRGRHRREPDHRAGRARTRDGRHGGGRSTGGGARGHRARPAVRPLPVLRGRLGQPVPDRPVLWAGLTSTVGCGSSWHGPTELLFAVPDMVTDEQVPLFEPLLICLHADSLRPVRPAERVAVVGCGPIGLLQIQVATVGESGGHPGGRAARTSTCGSARGRGHRGGRCRRCRRG